MIVRERGKEKGIRMIAHECKIQLAGCEGCAIHRSDDDASEEIQLRSKELSVGTIAVLDLHSKPQTSDRPPTNIRRGDLKT